MTVVEFVEKACGEKLSEVQKSFVEMQYKAFKENKTLYYIMPKHNGRMTLERLKALVLLVHMLDEGSSSENIQTAIKEKEKRND